MNKIYRSFLLTIALTVATTSVYGQESCCQEEGNYSSAYLESCSTPHWSIYIPIAILVGAAIWFGVADGNSDSSSSSNSQDGLGSMASSKRISHSKSGSYISSSYRSKRLSYGSNSHSN